jgi:hypothetical protein
MTTRTMYLFGSAALPVLRIRDAIHDVQARGWNVCLGLTPSAADWLKDELADLEALTGHPVRSRHRRPGEREIWPPADTILFAPVTANSLNAWALCLTPSWVVGVVAEGIGKEIPIVAMPCINQAYAAHPQISRSVETLRAAGVRVLYGPGGFEPNPSGTRPPYPWSTAIKAAVTAAD